MFGYFIQQVFSGRDLVKCIIVSYFMCCRAGYTYCRTEHLNFSQVSSVEDYTNSKTKLQALVYDILPSTTVVFSYAIGSRKLLANELFFVSAPTVVCLLQTTQIKQGVSFIAANKVCTSANKTTIVWIETELFFLPGVDASYVYVRAWALGYFYSHI